MHLIKIAAEGVSKSAVELSSGWDFVGVSPGRLSSPADLENESLDWHSAIVPGTVAQSLELAGRWSINSSFDFDELDWWYRCTLQSISPESTLYKLRFTGLATIAEIWLNGATILSSDNMFVEHSVVISELRPDGNELVICFRSLANALSVKRPRPQWKTNLVSNQRLRWFRTTLLGRIPGWAPPIAPVGPWRSIYLEHVSRLTVDDINISAGLNGNHGTLEFSCCIHQSEYKDIAAEISLSGQSFLLDIEHRDGKCYLRGSVEIDNVSIWWPHTHGIPQLYSCIVTIRTHVDEIVLDCGDIGFRRVELLGSEEDFSLSINGKHVFCRGACWTVADIVSLSANQGQLEHDLKLAAEAGMNMVRIGGTMLYESDRFYRLCDKLGIMVWQDFMFANMDYPTDDSHFLHSVEQEVSQQLRRLQAHPSVVLYCGNSEVEQQAAMLGMPRGIWRNELFSKILPGLCACWHIGTPYIASTPSGGHMPFNVGVGVTHYYGVGAYLRPLFDVKNAGVHFASECLGFSNVPEQSTVDKAMGNLTAVTHHPRWKSQVPRDTGASWDFEVIRDHYLQQLFGVELEQIKYFDNQRYFDLSRVVTGEVMSRVFQEWRQEGNRCQGGLVWFYKDLMPGAGWGIIDSEGLPKACYYYLKRAWSPQAVLLTDEGLDGLNIHVINDKQEKIEGLIELQLLDEGYTVTAIGTKEVLVEPGQSCVISTDELLDNFYDVTYAYRFGPKKHDVAAVTLFDKRGEVVSEASYYPQTKELVKLHDPSVTAVAGLVDGAYQLELESDAFLQAVHIDALGFISDDNYFCLLPGRKKIVRLRQYGGSQRKLRCYISALNMRPIIRAAIL